MRNFIVIVGSITVTLALFGGAESIGFEIPAGFAHIVEMTR